MIKGRKDECQNDSIILLSIPFQRLVRSHLSEKFINTLKKNRKLIIISPFGDNQYFKNQFNHQNIVHINVLKDLKLSKLTEYLEQITSILKSRGYWLRRKNDIPAMWKFRHLKINKKNKLVKVNLLARIFIDLISFIGLWKRSWEIFESLYGNRIYYSKEIKNITKNYKNVILIQASSWGRQDTFLANMSKRENWKTIFIPYTTDQLFVIGYLYCNYNFVCTKGRLETIWAENYHKVKKNKIIKLGSLYLNRIENINISRNNKIKNRKAILYIGISPTFFPEDLEIEAVKKIYKHLEENYNLKLIYRPVRSNSEDYKVLKSKFANNLNLEFQIPTSTSIGLDTYVEENTSESLNKLVSNFDNVILMISSYISSIYIEGGYLGVPTLSYLPKHNKMIKLLGSDKWLNNKNQFIYMNYFPTACNLNELIEKLDELYDNKDLRKAICEEIKIDWNYKDIDIYKKINYLINKY